MVTIHAMSKWVMVTPGRILVFVVFLENSEATLACRVPQQLERTSTWADAAILAV
jgi:hypothetical protein